jgi:hypothetical protein
MNGTQIERIKRIYRIIILPQRRQRKLRSSGRVEKWKSETSAVQRGNSLAITNLYESVESV